ncbi:hypothetical protein [Aliirhizobium smilacinae]|uniref:hypothetical protein n=1 Tax=Aliirhizobium smilacinae TaxID=1395944 RepID=UPI001FEAC813|nr:hypothetical protein [Rhizobium smilacinae]
MRELSFKKIRKSDIKASQMKRAATPGASDKLVKYVKALFNSAISKELGTFNPATGVGKIHKSPAFHTWSDGKRGTPSTDDGGAKTEELHSLPGRDADASNTHAKSEQATTEIFPSDDDAIAAVKGVTTRFFGLGRAEFETANWAVNALGDQTVLTSTKQSAAKFGEPQDVDRRVAPEADDGRSDVGNEGGKDVTAGRVKAARACRCDRVVSAPCISGEAGPESNGVIASRDA